MINASLLKGGAKRSASTEVDRRFSKRLSIEGGSCYVLRPFRALSTLRHVRMQTLCNQKTRANVSRKYFPNTGE